MRSQIVSLTRTAVLQGSNARFLIAPINQTARFSDLPKISEITRPNPEISPRVQELTTEILALNIFDLTNLMRNLTDKLGLTEEVLSFAKLSNQAMAFAGTPGMFAMGGGGGVAAPAVAAPSGDAAPAAAAAPAAKVVDANTLYVVKLVNITDGAKIKVLKEIRTLRPGMQLLESKAMVEKLPTLLRDNASEEEANKWKDALAAVGGEVELSPM
eukprot:TRINITY_DN2056_c0_g1_i1.p1 TRINITY_DN2056_c0_g1~~TRINITY_DN2056_c0_g1_i1.p1  ORF type:complete len:214 (-),score=105.14 TRINITY_DN2056_c0_g1_i1:105-746(-)